MEPSRTDETIKTDFKILVIDADKANCKKYRQILQKKSEIILEETANAKTALKKIEKSPPDIIICNHKLTGMNGIDLCRHLKQDLRIHVANIYFILVIPEKAAADGPAYLKEGIDDLIRSPVTPYELLASIRGGKRISTLLKKTELEAIRLFANLDVLLIQEGGCAPGYNPVTAFVTYHLEGQGRKVFGTREGFKSLVSGKDEDFLHLIYDTNLYKKMDHIQGVYHAAPLSEWRGAQLRGERYREFLDKKIQQKAAETIIKRKVNAIVAIGGNGTFNGIQTIGDMLPTSIQLFFIPVTIDSDIAGTDCIGQFTGVELGAEKIRCYMADARTHKRVYIVEMMGASSGFHALHSCLGARAHMAVLPNSVINHQKVVEALNQRDEAVIVVAEGYKKAEREAKKNQENAAQYFYQELLDTGLKLNKRIVCEAFSRDIRGAAPNNMDISLAQRMAYNVAAYLKSGTSRLMPAVRSGQAHAIPFNEIVTDNMKEKDILVLADRLTKKD